MNTLVADLDAEVAHLRAELARVNVCDRDVLPRFKGQQAVCVFERTLNGGGFRGETPAEMDAMLARHVAWARDVCPASDAREPW